MGAAVTNLNLTEILLTTRSERGKVMKTRREILKASAAYMGVLGSFGLLGGNALAQTPTIQRKALGDRRKPGADAEILKSIFNDALATRDMNKVLPKYEGKISPEQRTALEKLTAEDLKALANVKDRLAGSEELLSGKTGGIIY